LIERQSSSSGALAFFYCSFPAETRRGTWPTSYFFLPSDAREAHTPLTVRSGVLAASQEGPLGVSSITRTFVILLLYWIGARR
jgi:hypothetical protein